MRKTKKLNVTSSKIILMKQLSNFLKLQKLFIYKSKWTFKVIYFIFLSF